MEIEAKFQLDAPEPLRQRLRRRGARVTAHVLEVNRLFDTSDRRLLSADRGLRIRTCEALAADDVDQPAAVLTYKGPRRAVDTPCEEQGHSGSAPKSRAELETAVADAATLADILAQLGYQEVVRYEKRREAWRLGVCEITLDELPQLGWWTEIEGPDVATIEETRRALGLADTPIVPATYVEMAAAHGAVDARGCRRLVFEPNAPSPQEL